jgi:sigma-B regulation protein RsbU (phosphoserine phosphatase)
LEELPYNLQLRMIAKTKLIESLNTLNRITETLNQASDINAALEMTLTRLVDLMGVETGWIFLLDSNSQNQWAGKGFVLAAHYNLPPAMAVGKPRAWKGGCTCQTLCHKSQLLDAYNEVRCTRLASANGDKRGLAVHASAPLRAGGQILGILNVAGPDWEAFSEEALILLTNVGAQIGMALDRARLIEMMRDQRLHEQAALLDLSSKLLEFRLGIDELMTYVADEVRSLLQVDACALLLPSDEADLLAFHACSGWYSDPVSAGYLVPADERSGPGLVMQMQEPLMIEDLDETHQAARRNGTGTPIPASWTNEWLLAEGFRGHAVVPLIIEGRSLGAMVINMRQPRLLTDDELRFLQLVANQVALAIEKSRLHQEQIRRERLEEELAVGQQIQLSLLPETNPSIPGWEIASWYRAAQLVGGDFYDFFELPGRGRRTGMVIADASGKGVSAALFMALSRSILRTKALTGRNPYEVLRRSNRLIFKDSRSNMFLTIFYGILEPEAGRLTFSNAGHNRPLWFNVRTGNIKELATQGIVLGVFERVFLGEDHITMEPGDFLVCYTDGVTEAMNIDNELFGEDRLEGVIAANPDVSAQRMVDVIIEAVEDFIGERTQSDDLTLFVLKRQKSVK